MLSLALALLTPTASACGGFFCQTTPIDQAAERILFAIDEDKGQVEVQVQITYEGDAEDFAWVLPVPNEPELKVTVDDVLLGLNSLTRPAWNLSFETEGTCAEGDTTDIAINKDARGDFGAYAPTDESGGVTVVGVGSVGPYGFEILQADDPERLYEYLTSKDYALPAEVGLKLAPYVADGAYFVVLRLESGKSVGDLRPLALTYPGTEASIPLQLTAIAATDDMRLQPYVLSSKRAVPKSYLHVVVNEAAVDWLAGGANYGDVISAAADIAGGQAFATDFAGTTADFQGSLWQKGRYNADALRSQGTARPQEAMDLFQFTAGYPVSSGTAPFLSQVLPVPQRALDNGATDLQYWACPTCWGPDVGSVDLAKLADLMEQEWEPAMMHGEELLAAHPYLTRLTSSADADEMTVDPTFTLNGDMDDVSNQHQATLVTVCGDKAHTFEEAPRKVVLSDGRIVWLPSQADSAGWTDDNGAFDWAGYVGDAGIEASRVEKTTASGAPEVVTDNAKRIDDGLDLLEGRVADITCGCNQGAPGGMGALLLGLIAVVRRRR